MSFTSEYFESVGITVKQPKIGHRYGGESLALAQFCRIKKEEFVVELGSGCGVISLIIAARDHPRKITAIEIQKSLHEIAVQNISENKLDGVIECVNADYRKYWKTNGGQFDVVVSNPPFYGKNSGRLSINPERRVARHELNGTIEELVIYAKSILVPKGKLMLVFPKNRKKELLDIANSFGFVVNRIECKSSVPNFFVELMN